MAREVLRSCGEFEPPAEGVECYTATLKESFAFNGWTLNSTLDAIDLPMTISAFAGLFANVLVLFMSFTCKLITGHYRYFVANLAFLDLLFSMAQLVQNFVYVVWYWTDHRITPFDCWLNTAPIFITGLCLLTASPLIALNR